ncbi:unnamed protein product [Coregonus sp. 'balchen']|nr:unnamed protein product [Coregonus sp. 'balchen']
MEKESERKGRERREDPEVTLPVRQQSKALCWCVCLGLALILSSVVVGGASYYMKEGGVFECGVMYREEDMEKYREKTTIQEEEDVELDLRSSFKRIQENIRVLEDQEVALINVPLPEFEDGNPADIVHDFQRNLTAYLDLFLNKCYVIPLNTSIVMPPKNLLELLINIKAGTYMPKNYMVHEEMVVTERLDNVEQLGYHINNLCQGKDTYKLERRDRILGMQKREALNCHKIRHFESKFVVETLICEP